VKGLPPSVASMGAGMTTVIALANGAGQASRQHRAIA
jgi:hypothetical protein